MKTPTIPPIKMPEGDLSQYSQRPHQRYVSTKGQHVESVMSETLKPSFADRSQLNKLENTQTQFHDLAHQIRNTIEAMENIDANLAEMQDALESIIKIYPPYPPGSSERVEALRQFTALRNMIDQLTAPLTNESMDNIMADPDIYPHAGTREVYFRSSNIRMSIAHQPLHTGKDGLDIPNLDLNSSDQHISNAIEKIITAQKTIEHRQHAFTSDANAIISKLS